MGVTRLGTKAPYGLKAKALSFDIRNFNYENQVAPLMLSTKGRCVWSDKAVTGRLFGSVEKKFAELGPDTLFLSYYTEDRPVRAKDLLWALHQGVGKSILVLLNDSEAPSRRRFVWTNSLFRSNSSLLRVRRDSSTLTGKPKLVLTFDVNNLRCQLTL